MKPEIVNINILADKRAWVSFKLGSDYPHAHFDLPEHLLIEIFSIATNVMNEKTLEIKESIELSEFA